MSEVEFYDANDYEWEAYKQKFNKNYQVHEEAERRSEWEKTIRTVNKHNQEYLQGIHGHISGINEFSDSADLPCGFVMRN